MAFPALYASSFSGFCLPLMIVLWLLILRGISIEFRNHLENAAWKPFWDAVFGGSSALLAVFYGAALGNVVRGVPLDATGSFCLPLWQDFRLGPPSGILDWYTILAGVAALAALSLHGGLWMAFKTEDPVQERCRRLAARAWWLVLLLTLLVTIATFVVQPHVPERLLSHPWGLVFPALAVAGLAGIRASSARLADRRAFLASCAYLLGMLTSAAFGLYPFVLPANTDSSFGLTIHNTAAAPYALRVALLWWIPGMAPAAIYFWFTYRRFAGKVRLEEGGY